MFNVLLKELRAKRGLTQSQLAKEAGVSPGNVGDWESGKSTPGYKALAALARIFEVSADYLLELDMPPAKASDDLMRQKAVLGFACDEVPLDDEERDLLAMYRLLPDHKKEDAFDIIHTLYQKHVEKKKGSIYWTYKVDKEKRTLTGGGSASGSESESGGGIA